MCEILLRFQLHSSLNLKEHYTVWPIQNARDCIFQQDDARAHTAKDTVIFLHEFFGDRLITNIFWPPLSPNLTLLDFFLRGHLKNNVYKQTPTG